MSCFTVDPSGLLGVAASLAATGERMAGAAGALGAAAGDAGDLSPAVEDFCDAWRRSLRRAGEAAQQAARQLERAAACYAETDAAVAGAIGPPA
jgi:uncharacterized protein YukE